MGTTLEFLVFVFPIELGREVAKGSHRTLRRIFSEESIASKVRSAIFLMLNFMLQFAVFTWAIAFSGVGNSFFELLDTSRPYNSAEFAMLLVVVYFVSWLANFAILLVHALIGKSADRYMDK